MYRIVQLMNRMALSVGLVVGLSDSSFLFSEQITQAEAILTPTQGNKVKGKVTFTQVIGGVKVVADIEGLTPGKHGFHIHEKGDCSAPDAMSAGAHFNPMNVSHAGPQSDLHHAGDLGNIIADDDGDAHYDYTWGFLYLNGSDSIVGKSIIIHEKEDDLKTQPAGNSGARQACGVIKAIQDQKKE